MTILYDDWLMHNPADDEPECTCGAEGEEDCTCEEDAEAMALDRADWQHDMRNEE